MNNMKEAVKVKDLLVDYYTIPNIPIKNLANDIDRVIGQFKNSLKSGCCSPIQVIKYYKDYFDDIKKCFVQCVLNKDKSKSGIFVTQHEGYSIATAMKEKYDFHLSRKNRWMRYSLQKLYELALVELSLLLLTHGKVYDFQIKYAIVQLLCKHFTFYAQCAFDNSWSVDIFLYGQDDIETVYNMVLDTEVSELPKIDKELVVNILNKKRERITPKSINKPYCKEDLTILYDESTSQKDKKAIIAAHYNVSPSTAQRWMKRYGLLKESNNKKHEEKVAKERKEQETEEKNKKLMWNDIYKMVTPYAQAIIDGQNAQIQRLHQTIDKLKEEIESLKDENSMLKKNNLGGVKDNADTDWMSVDLKPKAMFG